MVMLGTLSFPTSLPRAFLKKGELIFDIHYEQNMIAREHDC